jgi:hypothetical protein
VTLVDSLGEALLTRRYAIEASNSEQVMIARAIADVRHYQTQRRDLLVAVVQDGAHEMWNLVRPELETLRNEGRLRSWSEAIDFCHLLERLSEALELCADTGRQWRLQSWRADLENKDGAIDSIASFLRFRRFLVRIRSHARRQHQQLCCGCLDQQLHSSSRPVQLRPSTVSVDASERNDFRRPIAVTPKHAWATRRTVAHVFSVSYSICRITNTLRYSNLVTVAPAGCMNVAQ